MIEHSFVAAARANISTIKHPTNPDLTATEMFPVFPDFEFWPNSYSLVSFDADPVSTGFEKIEKVSFKYVQPVVTRGRAAGAQHPVGRITLETHATP